MRLERVQELVEFFQMDKTCMFKIDLVFSRLLRAKISIVKKFTTTQIAGKCSGNWPSASSYLVSATKLL